MTRLITLSSLLFAFAACGDDNPGTTPDAMPDSDMADAPIDAPSYVWPTPVAVPLSTGGSDGLMSLAPGPSGSFYAAGFAAASPTDPKYLVVAKLTPAGALDDTFGTDGVYTSDVEFKGGNDEIDIAVQSDGKIVVAGTIANDADPDDRDIGLFRVDATGALDLGFGVTGFSRIDLSTGFDDAGTPKSLDSSRSLAVGPGDALFLHAASRNDTANDTDFTVARLTANGILDATYNAAGTAGMHFLELNETDAKATPKGLKVLSDGSVIASGYAKTTASDGKTQPVLYRLTPAGVLDTANFAPTAGFFHDTVLTEVTEIYHVAIDGNNITTAGYGHEALGAANQWASLRFDLTTGARSTTFGGTTNGVSLIDPSGSLAGSNCRNAVALPGGKTALLGSAGGTGARSPALAILTQNGMLDTSYGTGVNKFTFGGTEDQFWGGAVNGGKLMVVGWKGVGSTQTAGANDDARTIVLTIE